MNCVYCGNACHHAICINNIYIIEILQNEVENHQVEKISLRDDKYCSTFHIYNLLYTFCKFVNTKLEEKKGEEEN